MSNKGKARIIYVDGTVKEVVPKNGHDFQLDEMYDIIRTEGNPDPMVQVVPLRSKNELLVCEENAIGLGLPCNQTATVYCAVDVIQGDNGVQGTVLICPPHMLE